MENNNDLIHSSLNVSPVSDNDDNLSSTSSLDSLANSMANTNNNINNNSQIRTPERKANQPTPILYRSRSCTNLNKKHTTEFIMNNDSIYKTTRVLDDLKSNIQQTASLQLYHRYDAVYGKITLSQCSKKIIEHFVFARLRYIMQLGTVHFKYKYADHSRFEHSIGVAYLSRYVGQSLQRKHPEITDRMVLCIELAGLCHDLGHGPYSHSFDNLLYNLHMDNNQNYAINDNGLSNEQTNEPNTLKHEVRSQILFAFMIKDIRKTGAAEVDLTDKEIKLVQYFIDPKNYKLYFSTTNYTANEANDSSIYPRDVAPFFKGIEQIVNNNVHKVDVDKMDYLERDAYKLRFDQILSSQIDVKGVLKRSMIVQVENLDKKTLDSIWMFNVRDKGQIYDLICRRYLFFTNRYVHPDVHAINCMFIDALTCVNMLSHFTSCAHLRNENEIKNFCNLTDNTILEIIINSTDARLSTARELIDRIMFSKQLYKHVGDFVTSVNNIDESSYCELPWNIFDDKSTPTNLLPKVRYHQNGSAVNANEVKFVRRMFTKSPT